MAGTHPGVGASALRSAERPVALFSNGIGDTVLALPTLRALGDLFDGRLALVCDVGVRQVFLGDVRLRAVIECVMQRGEDAGARSFDARAAVGALGPSDLFLSLVPWRSAALTEMINLLQPRQSVGFFPDYDLALPNDHTKHAADLTFDVARRLSPGLRLEDYAAPPLLPLEVQRTVGDLVGALPDGARLLVLHADTTAPKMWPIDRFRAVLDLFLARYPEVFVFVVGRDPQPLAEGPFRHRIALGYGLSLGVSLGLVAAADLFLGIDSCMLHMADLARVPGVGLFGPTSSAEWGFRFGPHRHLQGDGAMSSIAVDAVVAALDAVAIAGSRPAPLTA